MATTGATLYSKETAIVVYASLVHFAKDRPQDYLKIEVVSYAPGVAAETDEDPIYVRLDPEGSSTTLVDQSQYAHCITNDGRKVDLYFGTPDERQLGLVKIKLPSD